jgi:hypothetical protein
MSDALTKAETGAHIKMADHFPSITVRFDGPALTMNNN